uniref:DUF4283 domain-containing protein n=1 Tax=Cannabis sativa TaxID=3483 RepID=A0A803Q255_CANSA
MKPWDPNTNFKKQDIHIVLIWVHLEDLELKYWGQRSLFKIIGQVGKPFIVDEVTKDRDRLNYPRVLIEVTMNQALPDIIEFEDEVGENTQVGVHYEWKPITCKHCFGLGHSTDDCRKKSEPKKEWVVKEDKRKNAKAKAQHKPDKDGFQRITKGWNTKDTIIRDVTCTDKKQFPSIGGE